MESVIEKYYCGVLLESVIWKLAQICAVWHVIALLFYDCPCVIWLAVSSHMLNLSQLPYDVASLYRNEALPDFQFVNFWGVFNVHFSFLKYKIMFIIFVLNSFKAAYLLRIVLNNTAHDYFTFSQYLALTYFINTNTARF